MQVFLGIFFLGDFFLGDFFISFFHSFILSSFICLAVVGLGHRQISPSPAYLCDMPLGLRSVPCLYNPPQQPALLVNARGLPAPQAPRAGIRSFFPRHVPLFFRACLRVRVFGLFTFGGKYLRWLRAAVPAFVRPSSLVLLFRGCASGGAPRIAFFFSFLLHISKFLRTFAPAKVKNHKN